jgi:hypothetical protein
MSEIFLRVLDLVARGEVLISDHGSRDHDDEPVHVLWGIPSHADSPAVVVTAYRPDASQWTEDFLRRKP